MPTIVLVGPHAIGKTTATARYKALFPELVVTHCDSKLPIETDAVQLCEGCAAHANQWLPLIESPHIIQVYCDPETMEQFMRQRCALNGKPYREDYWTPRMLQYEAGDRMVNLLRRLGLPSKLFYIRFGYLGWDTVDAYFKGLYQELA